MERKTIQVDTNTHSLLVRFCKDKKYNVGGWAAKAIMDTIYYEKYGKRPIEKISSKLKSSKK